MERVFRTLKIRPPQVDIVPSRYIFVANVPFKMLEKERMEFIEKMNAREKENTLDC